MPRERRMRGDENKCGKDIKVKIALTEKWNEKGR